MTNMDYYHTRPEPPEEPEWCERCGNDGHNGMHCNYEADDDQ